MSALLPFIVIGLVSGSVYGLAGTGLVLTYKTSGIFNFAQGSLGAVGAYVFYFLHVGHRVPWPVAAIVSVLILGPCMGIGLELLARRMALHGTAIKVAGTLGLVLAIESLAVLWYGSGFTLFPSYLPTDLHKIGNVEVGTDQIIIFAISLAAVVGLYLMLRITRLGIAMRAVVDNPELLSLASISPIRVRRAAWILGATFASLAGVLLGPSITLSASLLTLLVVQAFGAAAVGQFTSLPLTYVGGLLIGVAGAISTKYVLNVPWLGGLPSSLPFIVLFVALLVTPRRRLIERWVVKARPLPRPWQAPARVRAGTRGLALVFFLVLPAFAGSRQFAVTSWLIYTMLFLSLGLLVKTSGQVSLCQFGFAAVGAAGFGLLLSAGVPWGFALVLGAGVAIPIGAVVAFSAIRVSGIFLAVATYGFGVMLEQLVYDTGLMFQHSGAQGLVIARPGLSWLESDREFYFLVLGATVLTALVVGSLESGRFGRLLRALSDSAPALETQGATTSVTKLVVFCLSAFIAGLAGALLGSLYGVVNGTEYSSFSSLTLFVIVMLVFADGPWYALIAGATLTIVPTILNFGNVDDYLAVGFGVAAIGLVYQVDRPPAVPLWMRTALNRLGGRTTDEDTSAQASGITESVSSRPSPEVAVSSRTLPSTGPGLEVTGLSIRYGGVVAVDDFTFSAPLARITGLIGPNGAGKTSTFNACSGLIRPTEGTVLLHGSDVTRLGVAERARRGLGRTFQQVQLWESLTVRENVAMGKEASLAGRKVRTQIFTGSSDRRVLAASVDQAMELVDVAHLGGATVRELSTGQRRLVELARCLAGPFDLLLLDEPSSGLDTSETIRFGAVLRTVVVEREVGILLVEHDMALAEQVFEYIHVLDFGRALIEGSPVDVLTSTALREAYLGSNWLSDNTEGVHSAHEPS